MNWIKQITNKLKDKKKVLAFLPTLHPVLMLSALFSVHKKWILIVETQREISLWKSWAKECESLLDIIVIHYLEVSSHWHKDRGVWAVSIPSGADYSFYSNLVKVKESSTPLLITNRYELHKDELEYIEEYLGELSIHRFSQSYMIRNKFMQDIRLFLYNSELGNDLKYCRINYIKNAIFKNLDHPTHIPNLKASNQYVGGGLISITTTEYEKYKYFNTQINFYKETIKKFETLSILRKRFFKKYSRSMIDRKHLVTNVKLNNIITMLTALKKSPLRVLIISNDSNICGSINYSIHADTHYEFVDFETEFKSGNIDIMAKEASGEFGAYLYDLDVVVIGDFSKETLEKSTEVLYYSPAAKVVVTFVGNTYEEEHLHKIFKNFDYSTNETTIVRNHLELEALLNE